MLQNQWPAPPLLSPQQLQGHPLGVGIEVYALRLDTLHPLVSGNKWLKLYGWLQTNPSLASNGIISKGGAWSNHVHATAAWCHLHQLPFTAIIKAAAHTRTAMLDDVQQWGGNIIYAHRSEFYNDAHWQAIADAQQLLYIPMGGDGLPGVKGVQDYFDKLTNFTADAVWCATGTGTTAAGILQSSMPFTHFHAVNPGIQDATVDALLHATAATHQKQLQLHHLPNDRFGRCSDATIDCMLQWQSNTGLATDIMYTGKLLHAMQRHYAQTEYSSPQKILLIHTGGLQGNRSHPLLSLQSTGG
ncbi:pyridoxal-phosphate dependent enzyme [Phnomibacter ginsenosidimutans]|uniref:Pyridoxal-phosphate dependent enzyme n=1 Tax=Phnomibacter ginsenosidimutans TaxID=2676868 RepID=A0A6I6GU40_9BACT|nr:pyridoxal-phosphate dependent enzyme [Phnomibacter ginsenosidimutans]QGW28609.1 pyridoxal-phosphate dependent enzyme [Phnomibacter ginsenosidimutans]